MTRFVAPNLAGLAPPPAIDASTFDAVLASRIADLSARFTAAGLTEVAGVLALETEPLRIGEETDAFFEILLRQRINEAVRANLVASSTGLDLDHVVATFYGVARLAEVDAPRPLATNPEDWEDDDTFRARALLSLEARSTAGPEGAYVFQALETPGAAVLDAACYGEEDAARYANGVAVLAPEVLVVILARAGDGTASADLLATVLAQLNKEEVRPIGDKVTVEPATITTYSVSAVIRVAPGADATPLIEAARARVQDYVTARHRIGRLVQRLGIGAALKITDVEEIVLTLPVADIDPGSKGAAYCSDITITAEVAQDSWR